MKNSILVCGFTIFLVSMTAAAQTTEKYYMTVAKDGSGDYTAIQAAIDASKAFPDKRVTIFIKNGIYREKIIVPGCNSKLSLIGESVERTIISFDDYFDKVRRGRNSTFYTYTIKIEADDFYAENLTIENTAGPVGQAVALHVEGDRCSFRNCRFLGNQDTMYLAGQYSHQNFDSCYIEGTTDFIFGAATVVFSGCTVHSKSNSYITAASTPEGKPFGFVFIKCRLTAQEGVTKVYLGRPWRDYAKVAYINCEMGNHILPVGWDNWATPAREKTSFFAEYGNNGQGAAKQERASWSHQLSDKEALDYASENILKFHFPLEPSSSNWTRK